MRLEAKDISFSYPNGQKVLSHVNFHVESGEIVGLTAPSGYGKSTLGKILAGFLQPDEGRILIDGASVTQKKRADSYCPVQMIFQHPEKAVNPRWRMKKILNETWNPPEEMIRKMGIEDGWMKRWPAELSGGELQRFCVLRALSPQTRFLIADEMTTMLDMITQAQIWNVVTQYAKEQSMGIVVISHERYLLNRLTDRIINLSDIQS